MYSSRYLTAMDELGLGEGDNRRLVTCKPGPRPVHSHTVHLPLIEMHC